MSVLQEKETPGKGVEPVANAVVPASEDSVDNEPVTAAEERRLVRKLDLIIFPIFFIIYMMSFLDRINISNARIQGMVKDLDLHGNRFNVALFVSYPKLQHSLAIAIQCISNMIY